VHEQEQPAAVRQLVRLGTRLRLSDLGVGQTVAGHALAGSERRGLVPRSFSSVPRELPPKPLDGNAPGRTRLDADFGQTAGLVDIFGPSWTLLVPDMAERGDCLQSA
jgi:hypothetical protein